MRTKTIRRFPFSVSGLRGTLICLLLLCVLPLCGAGKVVRVVLDDNYPPFSFRDSDGVLQGVLIDEWKLWETKTGNHAELTAMDWNEALTRMKNGEFDVIDTIFETPERARFFDFTKPYFRINVPIFFRSDIAGIVDLHSLRGFPVGVKDGDAAVDVLAANGVTNLLKFPAYEDVISAAAHGKINVFIVDEPASLYFLSKMGIRSEFRQTTPVSAGEFHRAVRKGNTELLKTVENGFAKISPRERERIHQKWFGTEIQAIIIPQWTWVIVVVLAISVLLQLTAAVIALRLVRITGKTISWPLIAVALLLMSVRRAIPLYNFLISPADFTPNLFSESVGALLSLFMFVGVLGIRYMLLSQKRAQDELKRVNRIMATMSACDQNLVHAEDIDTLLNETCQVLINQSGYEVAWVSRKVNDEAKSVQLVAHAGKARDTIMSAHISWGDDEWGMGPTGTAVRTGIPVICHDVSREPAFDKWRKITNDTVCRSAASFPLCLGDETIGALTVYSPIVEAFDEQEVKLLSELAIDLAYGVSFFENRLAHDRAVTELEAAHRRMASIIEFLPDATFVIDREKRVIAWNRACEEMTGYRVEDIIGQGENAYAEAFFGDRRPMLIDLVEGPVPEVERYYTYVERNGTSISAEAYLSSVRNGRGAHLYGVATLLYDQNGERSGAIEVVRDITEQKTSELALRESEMFRKRVFDTSAIPIVVIDVENATIMDCNPAAVDALGFGTRENTLGKDPAAVSPITQGSGILSSIAAGEYINQAVREGTTEFEWRFQRPNGEIWDGELHLTVFASKGRTLMQCMIQDITERKRAERALQESRSQYRTLAEISPAGVYQTDRDGRTTYVNASWCRLSGLSPTASLGEGWLTSVHPDDYARVIQDWREALEHGFVSRSEYRFLHTDGTVIWVLGQATPERDRNGMIVGYIGVVTDITEQKMTEELISELNANLEQRVTERTIELEAANRELESFVYAVSHDLRSPLRAMIGFSVALVEDYGPKLEDEARMFLEQIITGSRRMGELIDGLLSLSRSTRGGLQMSEVDLSEIAYRIIEELRRIEPDRPVKPEVSAPIIVRGDPRMLEAVMRNLLDNAWKYTRDVPEAAIRVAIEEIDGTNWVSVTDNGAGFDPRHASRLFQPFQRLHRQDEFPGLGIGLATVQRIIQRHGGRIEATAEPGKGATFRFNLPGM
jgi:PAS domain S-box-containing protein